MPTPLAAAIAETFMSANGGSSVCGAIWQPAEALAVAYTTWLDSGGTDLPAARVALLAGLATEPELAALLWDALAAYDAATR